MMTKRRRVQVLTEKEVVEMLQKKQSKMTQKDFAKVVGISPAYLNDIYNLRRLPGPPVLRFLGLERGYWRKSA